MEIIGFIVVVVIVGLLILPNKKNRGAEHYARPDGCTCPVYTRWSMTLDYNCPVHGDWQEPLYPVEEIKAANEKEQANKEAGLAYNKMLADKWEKER